MVSLISGMNWGIFLPSFFAVLAILYIFIKGAPNVASIRAFTDILSDRGGVIAILLILTISFFISSMRLFYVAIQLMVEKKLEPENAIVLMSIQFCTNLAFGTCFGALLKTVNGNAPPDPPGTSTASTVTSVTTSEPAKVATVVQTPKDLGIGS